jgi:hypothetical protein
MSTLFLFLDTTLLGKLSLTMHCFRPFLPFAQTSLPPHSVLFIPSQEKYSVVLKTAIFKYFTLPLNMKMEAAFFFEMSAAQPSVTRY